MGTNGNEPDTFTAIAPRPVQTRVGFSHMTPEDGPPCIAIHLSTPIGTFTFFFDHDGALQIAEGLRGVVAHAKETGG